MELHPSIGIQSSLKMVTSIKTERQSSPSPPRPAGLSDLHANFDKNLRCCGLTLPTKRELIQYYQEVSTVLDVVFTTE